MGAASQVLQAHIGVGHSLSDYCCDIKILKIINEKFKKKMNRENAKVVTR